MNNVARNLQGAAISATADAINHELAKAWTKSNRELLEQFAMTGTLQRSFYVSQDTTIENAVKILQGNNPQDIAETIVKGRNEGFVRSFPIIGLVHLSMRDTELFKKVFCDVVQTGNDLKDFLDICHKMRGFGRAVKTALKSWLSTKLNVYYAQKYRTAIADAMRICHFNGETSQLSGYVLCQYGESMKTWCNEKFEESLCEPSGILRAHEAFIMYCNNGNLRIALSVLDKFKFDVDSLSCVYDKFDKKIWRKIAEYTPTMRFLKYLDKFDREGVFAEDATSLAEEKLTVKNLKKAKVFPYRLFVAYNSVSNVALRNILARTMDDYVTEMDWGEFGKFSWAICPDVSGSMGWSLAPKSPLSFSDVAGSFAAMFHKGIENSVVIPWADRVFVYPGNRYDSIVTQVRQLKHLTGGTDMSCALREMIRRKNIKDCFVFITDTEEYGRVNWINSWMQYRKQVNPKAIAFVIRCDPYTTNPFPNDIAERNGVYPIYGFNDNVFTYIEYILKKQRN